MQTIAIKIRRLLRDEAGVTAIEYVLIASIIGLTLVPVLANTTSGVASLYQAVKDSFDAI